MPATTEDPGHHMWYVKTFCTHKDLGKFTVYFPYILLISALLLMSIERLINKIFKSKEQIEGFHSLLTQKNDNEMTLGTGPEDGQDQMSDEIHTVEVWQSFKHNSTFFPSYLLRTIFELIFSFMLTLYFVLMGMSELINWNDLSLTEITLDDFLNLKKDNVRIFCDVHGDFYECAGVPTQVNFT